MTSVAVIIPVLNEAAIIVPALQRLQPLRAQGLQLIVVDGGSIDNTRELAMPLADRVVESEPGRGRQMNAGAASCQAQWLFFLHVDTLLPEKFAELLDALDSANPWGFFRLRLSGRQWLLRSIAKAINWRSRLSGIGTGDQVLFVQRDHFSRLGGFSEIPLMEDVDLSKKLRRDCRPYIFSESVITSSRRWEENGILRTVLLMWALRLAYFLGVSPHQLARYYR